MRAAFVHPPEMERSILQEKVQSFLNFFRAPGRRESFDLGLSRSGRYLAMIQRIFKDHDLPRDLAYVAMIESEFDHTAVSRKGASGLWQFTEQTARGYGLRVDLWVDERLDPEKSTLAAARYLRHLFAAFDSWLLAKAAYNAGRFAVTRAVLRSRTNDFWVLSHGEDLREETKRFVPAVLAAALIGKNPSRFGFKGSPEPPLSYDFITIPPLLSLSRLAARTGIPPQELRRLNAELVRGVSPPGETYVLKVPPGSKAAIERGLAGSPAIQANWPLASAGQRGWSDDERSWHSVDSRLGGCEASAPGRRKVVVNTATGVSFCLFAFLGIATTLNLDLLSMRFPLATGYGTVNAPVILILVLLAAASWVLLAILAQVSRWTLLQRIKNLSVVLDKKNRELLQMKATLLGESAKTLHGAAGRLDRRLREGAAPAGARVRILAPTRRSRVRLRLIEGAGVESGGPDSAGPPTRCA